MKIILMTLVIALFTGCSPNELLSQGIPVPPINPFEAVSLSFDQSSVAKDVDILFVVDNSTSMNQDQENIGTQFSSFISHLSEANYRVGFINTDSTSIGPDFEAQEGFYGKLVSVGPAGEKYIAPYHSNKEEMFLKAITEQSPSSCEYTFSECNEEPMWSSLLALHKKDSENAGFFREGAELVIVILSDEDEQSIGGPTALQPGDFLLEVKRIMKLNERQLTVITVAIPPTDQACLDEQRNESISGRGGNPGGLIFQAAELSGGFGVSLCQADFGTEFKKVSEFLKGRLLYKTIELEQPPADRSKIEVIVELLSGEKVPYAWVLNEKTLTLIPAPPSGSKIEVKYNKFKPEFLK